MAWGKPEEKPAAAPPEEKPAFNIDEFFSKMNENLSAQIAPLKSAVDDTRTRLQAIEDRSKPKEAPNPEVPSVIDNEDAAFATRLMPLAAQQIELKARMIERDVIDEMRENGWDDQIADVKTYLANVPLATKAQENYESMVRNVVDMAIGKAAQKSGLRRRNNSFILEDANAAPNDPNAQKATQEDREFLNFEVVTGKGKHVTRREMLERTGVLVEERDAKGNTILVEKYDLSDPKTLAAAKKSWSNIQVVS